MVCVCYMVVFDYGMVYWFWQSGASSVSGSPGCGSSDSGFEELWSFEVGTTIFSIYYLK